MLAIVLAAFIAGTINILCVCIDDGWDIPYYIAAGLVGRGAINGGAGLWVLGMALHFIISCIGVRSIILRAADSRCSASIRSSVA